MATKKKTNRPERGPDPRVQGPLAKLVHACGTYPALAKEVGVSVRTLQRYNDGDFDPPLAVRVTLSVIAQRYGIKAPFSTAAGKV
jgi:hypothetical protein